MDIRVYSYLKKSYSDVIFKTNEYICQNINSNENKIYKTFTEYDILCLINENIYSINQVLWEYVSDKYSDLFMEKLDETSLYFEDLMDEWVQYEVINIETRDKIKKDILEILTQNMTKIDENLWVKCI